MLSSANNLHEIPTLILIIIIIIMILNRYNLLGVSRDKLESSLLLTWTQLKKSVHSTPRLYFILKFHANYACLDRNVDATSKLYAVHICPLSIDLLQ